MIPATLCWSRAWSPIAIYMISELLLGAMDVLGWKALLYEAVFAPPASGQRITALRGGVHAADVRHRVGQYKRGVFLKV
jgi:hypothetical protein